MWKFKSVDNSNPKKIATVFINRVQNAKIKKLVQGTRIFGQLSDTTESCEVSTGATHNRNNRI